MVNCTLKFDWMFLTIRLKHSYDGIVKGCLLEKENKCIVRMARLDAGVVKSRRELRAHVVLSFKKKKFVLLQSIAISNRLLFRVRFLLF